MQFPHAVMAAPAFLLLIVTIVAGISRGGTSDENDGGGGGRFPARGSAVVDEGGGEAIEKIDGISLERHHGHHNGRGSGNGKGPAADPSDRQGDDGGFDFYVYSMSYQPEFCRENNDKFAGCRSFKEEWEGQLTIHGLWPNRNDGTWPSACTDEKLDLSLLEDVRADLEERWPNVKAPSASPGHEAFWAHEWSKHGTCSGLEQQDYFMTALDLLMPTPDVVKEKYGSAAMREELEAEYLGEDMTIFVCKSGYLSEVRVCLEKMEDGAPGERVTCPEDLLREDSCGDEIKIASFGSKSSAIEAVE
mmetsp:Transcript_27476/g.58371  ORF Transcript_27476/g.58371 Transcript_27476/m.58371 type:complete len:304 (+) Transcript_27476:276-1187(+)